MKRRHFTASLAGSALAAGLAPVVTAAQAQGAPVEGQDYKKLLPPVPVAPAPGKVDVVEFFSYACPHCAHFEPALEAWIAKLPPYAHFHRIPVPFLMNKDMFQPLYYALEAMDLTGKMQQKVFDSVHVDHVFLTSRDQIGGLMTRNGIDATKFLSVFDSFSVRSRVQAGQNTVRDAHIDEVPTLMVQGRFLTSPAMAGGEAQALAVVDALVKKVHAGG